MNDFSEFQKMVTEYATAYGQFENMQKRVNFIAKKGDQKTGVIGEAYIFEYLSRLGRKPKYGITSQKGWDIKCSNDKYQVKTVSDYSESQIISPIHDGWDILFLVHLNKNFEPDKIFKIKNPDSCGWSNNIIRGRKFPNDSNRKFNINGILCTIEDETNRFMEIMGIKKA